ncbi:sigma-70 family RNA polymerase sigma factor [Kitasatospora terrestris]|uniref:Sigma-70 family RNA polymerase sigma factor n=1 Tax=Kitasatospora terrestris TaxID=258051 RepID=A0ABP9EBF3_9ACTN
MLPVTELRPALTAFLTVLATGAGVDADDLEQSVWLRAMERSRTSGLPVDVRNWLRGLAVREALSGRGGGPETAVARVTQRHRGPEEELLRAERSESLRRALDLVPGRCRELLEELAASPDLTYRQLADRLDLPRGSIGPLRSRCLGRLRSLVAAVREE